MSDFYHVFIRPTPGVSKEDVEKSLSLCLDWFRYYPNCYVVYSSSSVAKLNERLKIHAKPNGNLLILKIDATKRQGWMSRDFWTWLKQKRE